MQPWPSGCPVKFLCPSWFSFPSYLLCTLGSPCTINSIEELYVLPASSGWRISSLSLPVSVSSKSYHAEQMRMDNTKPISQPSKQGRTPQTQPLEVAHPHGVVWARFLTAQGFLHKLEVGHPVFISFSLQHSLGPAELLMSGSLPCKLQNENTAKHKGHCLCSVHLVLTWNPLQRREPSSGSEYFPQSRGGNLWPWGALWVRAYRLRLRLVMCGERFPCTRLSSDPSGVSEQGTALKTALALANKPGQMSQALYLRDLLSPEQHYETVSWKIG